MKRCEVLTNSGWRGIARADLKAGALFRLFDEEGPVEDEATGARRWRALADARSGADGDWEVDAEPVPDTDVELTVREQGVYWPGTGAPPATPRRLR